MATNMAYECTVHKPTIQTEYTYINLSNAKETQLPGLGYCGTIVTVTRSNLLCVFCPVAVINLV